MPSGGGGEPLFPACAGVILVGVILTEHIFTFPRMCGGDPTILTKGALSLHFSPHVRG